MTATELAKKRQKYVLERERLLIKKTKSLQDKLMLRIIERIIDVLDLEEGKIKPTKANIEKVSRVDAIYREFLNQDMSGMIKGYISDLSQIRTLNQRYFEQMESDTLVDMSKRINTSVNFRLGLDDKGRIIGGGFLDSFIKDPNVRNQIRLQILRGVTGGESKINLLKNTRALVTGSEVNGNVTDGNLERYFKTFLTDTYSIYDAELSDGYATELGLDHAIYAGTEIESSRPFCIERIGKVFTREEISKFGTSADKYGGYSNKSRGEFQGKPPNYNPFRDRGGYHCRHPLNWITYAMAVRLRPDLKKVA